MEAQDPLNQLADIHLPEEVGFWPLAPGWWLLACVLLFLLAWGLMRLSRALVRRRREQAAILELTRAYSRFYRNAREGDPNQAGLDYLYELNSLLKRVAIHVDSAQRERIAELHGTPWLHYLDETLESSPFSRGPGKVLAEGQYQPEFRGDAKALHALAKEWIHRRYRSAQAPTPGTRLGSLVRDKLRTKLRKSVAHD